MDYKSLMGFSKKKKVVKETPKPKVNKVLQSVKKDLKEQISPTTLFMDT